jgi:lysophospholipase L1-like esterase
MRALFLSIVVCASIALAGLAAAESRWENEIAAFEKKDRESPPPEGAVLFLGSSSIRFWDLDRWFPDLMTINRGFGGSQISDSIEFASRIVLPYQPHTIVFYAGDNDIDSNKTPETVFEDFKKLAGTVHSELPKTRIVFIAIKPSLARWEKVGAMREANRLIREWTETDDRLSYVDVDAPMLGEDGKPRAELLLEDGLHLTDKGYGLWAGLVREHLEESEVRKRGVLNVATCQFPVSGSISENAEWVRKQMCEADEQGADIVHFSEVAFSGYPGVDMDSMENYDWDLHKKELESVLTLADERNVWVVLGSAHRLKDHKPHNSLYVIDPEGKVVDRYDKRFCTNKDLKSYSPGDHFVTFDANGVKCGLLVCYDVRFPELYRQYSKLGVQRLKSFCGAYRRQNSVELNRVEGAYLCF